MQTENRGERQMKKILTIIALVLFGVISCVTKGDVVTVDPVASPMVEKTDEASLQPQCEDVLRKCSQNLNKTISTCLQLEQKYYSLLGEYNQCKFKKRWCSDDEEL